VRETRAGYFRVFCRAEQDVNSVGKNLMIQEIRGLVGGSVAEDRVGWRSRQRWMEYGIPLVVSKIVLIAHFCTFSICNANVFGILLCHIQEQYSRIGRITAV